MRRLFVISFVALSVACGGAEHFGDVPLDTRPEADVFLREWFSKHLEALREDPLNGNRSEVYRFLWLRTFDEPVAVRIHLDGPSRATLYVKVTDGAGGYEPGNLMVDRQRQLELAEIRHLRATIDSSQFWSLSTSEPEGITLDGSRWIVEGARAGRYHVVQRHSPDPGPVRELGLELIRLTGLDFEVY